MDPCECALNADCDARNHRGYCTCIPNFTGDPYGYECIPIPEPIVEEPDCITDGDCPSKEGCYDGVCKNPCLEERPCAQNADCIVYDDLPMRTMVCICREGYTGKGDQRCDWMELGSDAHWRSNPHAASKGHAPGKTNGRSTIV